jgi:hypothetical protein
VLAEIGNLALHSGQAGELVGLHIRIVRSDSGQEPLHQSPPQGKAASGQPASGQPGRPDHGEWRAARQHVAQAQPDLAHGGVDPASQDGAYRVVGGERWPWVALVGEQRVAAPGALKVSDDGAGQPSPTVNLRVMSGISRA